MNLGPATLGQDSRLDERLFEVAGDVVRDRLWPTESGWLARAQANDLHPQTSWGLLRCGASLPSALGVILRTGRLSSLGASLYVWRLQDDPVLASASLAESSLTIRAYKPLKRCVVHDRSKNVYLKYQRPRDARRTAQLSHQIESQINLPFSVPRVTEWSERSGRIVFEGHDGTSASEALRTPSTRLDAAQVLGTVLGGFHTMDLPKFRQFTRIDEMKTLGQWIALAGGWTPHSLELRTAWQLLVNLASRIATSPYVVSHRDYHDGQVLLSDSGPTLLDLDTLTHAEPELDLGNLLAHLDLAALDQDGAESTQLDDAFLGAYREVDVLHENSYAVAWYRASACLRLACVHMSRPETSHLHQDLVALGLEQTRALAKSLEERP